MDKYLAYVNLEFTDGGETVVNIRQSNCNGGVNIITVLGANFAPLMYQLKAIETLLLFGNEFAFQHQQVQEELAREIMDTV